MSGLQSCFVLESAGGAEADCREHFVGLDAVVAVIVQGNEVVVRGEGEPADLVRRRLLELAETDSLSVFGVARVLQDAFRLGASNDPAYQPGYPMPLFFVLGAKSIWTEDAPRLNLRHVSVRPLEAIFVVPRVLVRWRLGESRSEVLESQSDSFPQMNREWLASCLRGIASKVPPPAPRVPVHGMLRRDAYVRMVERCVEYILDGDAYQIVVGFEALSETQESDVAVFSRLATLNPAPYMFCVQIANTSLIGSSPELLIRVEGGSCAMRPLAGTLSEAAGKTWSGLAHLDKDPKECAEHVMLVDLCRNDLGRICQYGTVRVRELLEPVKFPGIVHLSSLVVGTMRAGYDCWDALRACTPAGTMIGCPKIRASEIISELEVSPRGLYSGVIGIAHSEMDLVSALIIRSIVRESGLVSIRASAGIVAGSTPESEWLETLTKISRAASAVTATRIC